MLKLDNCDSRFHAEHFGTLPQLQQAFERDQQEVLCIACCDHGSAPDNISLGLDKEMLIVQNLAATVPHASALGGATTIGSVQFSVCMMEVSHVIVCGHLHCNILRSWLKRNQDDTRSVENSLFSHTTRANVDGVHRQAAWEDRVHLLAREHVLVQLENLLSHAFIRTRVERGSLQLHGWLVDDASARVQAFDPAAGEFRPL